MNRIVLAAVSLALLAAARPAAALTAAELLATVDSNQSFATERFKARMTILKQGRRLVKEFSGYGMKEGQKFFMAFSNPEDRGVKYLKLDDELWIWLPDAQDSMRISGHMLRQGMMGSDLSYEDMLKNETLLSRYDASLAGTTNLDGAPCERLVLRSRYDDAAYFRRDCLVDAALGVVRRVDLYAKSGRLLKRMSFDDVRAVGARNVAFRSTVRDMTRRDSVTVVEFLDLSFDAALPAGAFSKSALGR
jgi:outer membrane lipoprotein-sorting protein